MCRARIRRAGLTCCSTLGSRADMSCLPVDGPGVRLARAPGAERCLWVPRMPSHHATCEYSCRRLWVPITLLPPLTWCLLLDQGGQVRHLAARGSHVQALSVLVIPVPLKNGHRCCDLRFGGSLTLRGGTKSVRSTWKVHQGYTGGGWGLLEPVGVFRRPGVRGGSLAGSARRRPRWKGSLRPVLLPAGLGIRWLLQRACTWLSVESAARQPAATYI